ncbi:MAG: hypothetical protein LC800_18450 [Acidobacteria bacterium]|nr:hypothetical protein [Acidobacteriota bacterium]
MSHHRKFEPMNTSPAPTLARIALLFALSFLVTAIFSVSLKTFFAANSWGEVLAKGLLIPCFTWAAQLLLSVAYLGGRRRMIYWEQLGVVCLAGSAALMPAAVYNFAAGSPRPGVSAANVLASVVLMAAMFYGRVRSRGFGARWAASWIALICVNMSLYLYSIS